jgi:putative zinc finger/helix-turn-helix YgiT family protein
MLEYCLNCNYEKALELKIEPVTITVRGEAIETIDEFYQCPVCEEKFTTNLEYDSLEKAYREYRSRHNLVQPDEIRDWREHYGLTRTEFSRLLEWEEATLNRLEQGALQEVSEDQWLKFIMVPQNLLYLIISKPETLSAEKQEQLISQLSANRIVVETLQRFYNILRENFSEFSKPRISRTKQA